MPQMAMVVSEASRRTSHSLSYQPALDEHLADRAGPQPGCDPLARLLSCLGEAATAPAEGEGGAHHDWRGQHLDEAHPVGEVVDDRALGHRLADAGHQVPESAPVLGGAHCGQRSPEHSHPVSVQHAGIVERHGQVEARLAAERREQRVGPVLLDDAGQI